MNIYSIKNEKIGYFNRPIYCESENEALTYIQNVLMSDSDRALSSLKGDLALYFLGSIDFISGKIKPNFVDFVDDCDGYVSDSIIAEPFKICDLEDIFNTIPEDKLKPALTVEHYELLRNSISDLNERFKDITNRVEHHVHAKKDGAVI